MASPAPPFWSLRAFDMSVFSHRFLNSRLRERRAQSTHEQTSLRPVSLCVVRPHLREVRLQELHGVAAEGDYPVLGSLALVDSQQAALQIAIKDRQAPQPPQPNPGGI